MNVDHLFWPITRATNKINFKLRQNILVLYRQMFPDFSVLFKCAIAFSQWMSDFSSSDCIRASHLNIIFWQPTDSFALNYMPIWYCHRNRTSTSGQQDFRLTSESSKPHCELHANRILKKSKQNIFDFKNRNFCRKKLQQFALKTTDLNHFHANLVQMQNILRLWNQKNLNSKIHNAVSKLLCFCYLSYVNEVFHYFCFNVWWTNFLFTAF